MPRSPSRSATTRRGADLGLQQVVESVSTGGSLGGRPCRLSLAGPKQGTPKSLRTNSSKPATWNSPPREATYEGSQVDFLHPATREVTPLLFESGVAALHRGPVPHATHAITAGSRSNLVMWLYGDSGQMPRAGVAASPADAKDRWTPVPDATGSFAPF